jgi:hypothetical protein
MNELQIAKTTEMSSLELVALINKNREVGSAELSHTNFTAKIRKVLGGEGAKFSAPLKTKSGQIAQGYLLPARETHLMVMSDSYKVQAAVYDRMVESEIKLLSAQKTVYVLPEKEMIADLCALAKNQKAQTMDRYEMGEFMFNTARAKNKGLDYYLNPKLVDFQCQCRVVNHFMAGRESITLKELKQELPGFQVREALFHLGFGEKVKGIFTRRHDVDTQFLLASDRVAPAPMLGKNDIEDDILDLFTEREVRYCDGIVVFDALVTALKIYEKYEVVVALTDLGYVKVGRESISNARHTIWSDIEDISSKECKKILAKRQCVADIA